MDFMQPLANASDFTLPKILALPTNEHNFTYSQSLKEKQKEGLGSESLVFNKGRNALSVLAEALLISNDGASKVKVWCPVYHCPALIEPFLREGIDILFYPVDSNLEPDFIFLDKHLAFGNVVVGVRFFGFLCGISKLSDICRKKECLLIEDLAHSFFFPKLYGDYAVTSYSKFFPVKEGAELICRADMSSGLYKEKVLEVYKSLPSKLNQVLFTTKKKILVKLGLAVNNSKYRYFNESTVFRNISRKIISIVKHSDLEKIKAKRRENYLFLHKKVSNSGLGRPLFETLPTDVTPYVLPFLLNEVEGFSQIRGKGVQLYRWEEIVATESKIANDYRSRLVQIPCHQDLTKSNLQYLAAVLI